MAKKQRQYMAKKQRQYRSFKLHVTGVYYTTLTPKELHAMLADYMCRDFPEPGFVWGSCNPYRRLVKSKTRLLKRRSDA